MKNIIVGSVGILAVIGVLILIAGPKQDTKGAVKDLKYLAAETFYDFGTVSMAKGKVRHIFEATNTGTEPVLISKIYTSCMCTEAELKTATGGEIGPFGMQGHGPIPTINQVILPGETAEVEAVFDPAAHGPAGIGIVERAIILESGDQSLELSFRVNVRP